MPSFRGARPLDVFLFLERGRGDVFLADELRIGRGDVHREIAHQFLKIVGARHEVGLAIDFHQHAQLRAGVNVGSHRALLGGARRFLAGGRDAALAQHDFRFGEISLCFGQSALALHHSGSGTFAELLSLDLR